MLPNKEMPGIQDVVVVQQVETLNVMPDSQTRALVQALAALLLIQLPAKAPGNATEDGPSARIPDSHGED